MLVMPLTEESVGEVGHMTQLHDLIVKYFSLEEVEMLCYRLEIPYEDLPGGTKSAKVREMLDYLVRRDRLNELINLVRQDRPNAQLPEIEEDTQDLQTPVSKNPRPSFIQPKQTFNILGDIHGKNINLGGTQHIENMESDEDEPNGKMINTS